jgi:hypothetical protein
MAASFQQKRTTGEPKSVFAALPNRFLRVAFFLKRGWCGASRRNQQAVVAPSTTVIVSARGRQRFLRSEDRHAAGPNTAAASIRHR